MTLGTIPNISQHPYVLSSYGLSYAELQLTIVLLSMWGPYVRASIRFILHLRCWSIQDQARARGPALQVDADTRCPVGLQTHAHIRIRPQESSLLPTTQRSADWLSCPGAMGQTGARSRPPNTALRAGGTPGLTPNVPQCPHERWDNTPRSASLWRIWAAWYPGSRLWIWPLRRHS